MSKEQQRQEARSMARRMLAYDLSKVNPEHYAAPLGQLFHTPKWIETMKRRSKLVRSLMDNRDNTGIFKKIEETDRQVKEMIFTAMVEYQMKLPTVRRICLQDFFNDFIKTREQHEIYADFKIHLNLAIAIFDCAEAYLVDAREDLKKLDPTCLLQEFDGLKGAIKPLRDFSDLRYHGQHPELADIFTDFIEDVQTKLAFRTKEYLDAYTAKYKELEIKHELKPGTDEAIKH